MPSMKRSGNLLTALSLMKRSLKIGVHLRIPSDKIQASLRKYDYGGFAGEGNFP